MYTGRLVRLRRVDPARDLEDRYRWMNDPAALIVNAENAAGIRAYEKAGFVREGLLRSYGYINGRYYNALIMAILRDEYLAGKGRSA